MNFVIAFAPLFSKPVFKRVKVLLMGAILSPASRTVTNALRVMGLSGGKTFSDLSSVFESGALEFFGGFTDCAKAIDKGIWLIRQVGHRVWWNDWKKARRADQSQRDLSGCGAPFVSHFLSNAFRVGCGGYVLRFWPRFRLPKRFGHYRFWPFYVLRQDTTRSAECGIGNYLSERAKQFY